MTDLFPLAPARIECPRVVPPCDHCVEGPTRYEALMELVEHLHDTHGIWRSEAMALALTAPGAND
jgi:predicted small metal-binding protein